MTKPIWLLGFVLAASCSSPVPIDEDAGQVGMDGGTPSDGGSSNDSGTNDGGSSNDAGLEDGGALDGGGGSDAGCVGTAAAQLGFASAPQTLDARVCSAALKVQLQTACGAPVNTATDLPVAFAASGPLTEVFGDAACIGKPSVFVIPGGSNSLDVFFRDPSPGMTTISATAAGLDGGSQLETIVCATGEKACNANSCIPTANCCSNADCTAPKICKTNGQCGVPTCAAFVNGCTSSNFIQYDGGSIAVASPFNPKCVKTSTSSSVKFSNSGVIHPLEQTCGPKDVTLNTFGSTVTVTGLSSFGTYGFRCANHTAFEFGTIQAP